jgi:hypothetical protein
MSVSLASRDFPHRFLNAALLLACCALIAACSDNLSAEDTLDKTPASGGAIEATGGDTSSGGTPDTGIEELDPFSQGGENAGGPGTCARTGDDFYVQVRWQGREYRFTEAPTSEVFWPCANCSAPAYYSGGVCVESMIAACNDVGDCIRIADNHLSWTLADGTSRLELKHEPSSYQANYLITEEFKGRRTAGKILIDAEGITMAPDNPIELPITGSYSTCYAGGDFCLL